ncbi:hypothetical protein AAVH_22872 [Aphelenchoides avenae]|nr:hypothetical protein AAVH_22872 [Aphelenchus avenae]
MDGIPVHVPTTCKDFDTTSFKFGKLEYDKDPVGNVTDDNDVYDYSYNGAVSGEVKVVNAYPNGTLARVVCKEGYGTYLDDDGLATNRVEKEVNTTCIDGGWTVDLDIYTRSPPETTYDFLVCEPHNADWKSSSKEDYFGVDHGAYGGSRDEGAEDDEDAADNSTEPRLKCYQGYEVARLLLRDCKKGAKSCRSEDRTWEAGVLLTCSDEPCEFNGKVVDTAVCYNTSADWEERCCCYGDGCNENTLRGEYLAKGINVKSPSSCVGFDAPGHPRFGFSNGEMVYSEEPTGTVDFSEDYVDYSMYPNGTVA